MSLTAFFGISVAVQLIVLALDLADRHATRAERHGGEQLRSESLLFLLGVIGCFLVIQLLGFAWVPRVDALVERVRTTVAPGMELAPAPRGWRLAMLGVGLFYAEGLVDYAWHRWFSHHPLFWFTHESHHLPSEIFVGMPGLGVRPFAVLTVVPVVVLTAALTYAVLRVAALPAWSWTIFQIPLLASSTLLVVTHSSFMRRGWWAHRLLAPLALTSPQEHVLHHTVDLQGNYGNFTTIWDRLFGTYLDPRRDEHQGHRFGLAYDRDFLGTITAGALRLPASWRRRFQVGRYCNLDDVSDAERADA
jgi:sterol desaturase/sphingolipid hydroxylase (fatty acid hydroxylase superfamily)